MVDSEFVFGRPEILKMLRFVGMKGLLHLLLQKEEGLADFSEIPVVMTKLLGELSWM